MKRGQQGIGLVILGVVAIIAVIGLVLLFTRASAEGAASTELSIGNIYGGGNVPGEGIVTPPDTVQYQPGYVPMAPQVSYPAPVGYSRATHGTRTPAYVVLGYTSLEDLYGCNNDLTLAGIYANDMFNCFALPSKGSTSGNAEGMYPPASSAYKRPATGDLGKTGGDIACYRNSVGEEGQVANGEKLTRDLLLRKLVDGSGVSTAKHPWKATMINGERVPVCWVSQKEFPFPQ